MAQFDVYANPNSETRDYFPFLMDIQDGMLDLLSTRVVVPIIPLDRNPQPMQKLNPLVQVGGKQYMVSVPELAGVSKSMLNNPVANLSTERNAIIAALDLLFTGI